MATKFIPFWNPEHYFSDLLRCGTSSDHVEHLRRLHEEHPIEKVPAPVVDPKPVLTIEEVIKKTTIRDPWKKPDAVERMKSRVSKFPHINTQPLEDLYAKYSKPPRMPPLNERIKALKDCGYSDEILMNVIKSHEKKMAESDELDAFIFNIFGEQNEKKQSAPKKRTITQILKIKKRVYARPDIEDDENDDAVSEFEDLPTVDED